MQQSEQKLAHLKDSIKKMGRVAIGFSGGVDSTFLLKVAYDLLGDQAVAITTKTATVPEASLTQIKELAKEIGAPHRVIHTENMALAQNDANRCYHCKKSIFKTIQEAAREEGITTVLDGSNYDDLGDYRPGRRALKELQVRSPLLEAELTKKEIRQISKELGLSTWDKPSFACLITRFPYGIEITQDKVNRIGGVEGYIRQFLVGQLRVRHHDDRTVRIEVLPEDMPLFLERREEIVEKCKEYGYLYVTLDLQGYRSGSMDEVLAKTEIDE